MAGSHRVDFLIEFQSPWKLGTLQTNSWKSVREKVGNLEMLAKHRENTRNFVCLKYEFPDLTDQGYCYILPQNYKNLLKKMNVSAQSVSHMKQSQIIEICTGKCCGQTEKKLEI